MITTAASAMRDSFMAVSRWKTSAVRIGDRQLLRRIQRNNLRTVRRQNHFFLDAGRGKSVARRTVRFDREHHPDLELDRVAQRIETRYQRALVQSETEAVAKVESERFHFTAEADLLRGRK